MFVLLNIDSCYLYVDGPFSELSSKVTFFVCVLIIDCI